MADLDEKREYSFTRVARAVSQRLEVNRLFGWDVPLAPRVLEPAPGFEASPASPESPAPHAVDREALLEPLRQQVASCTACPLCRGRTNTVFGVGDPHARLLFVGEGPGYDEDRQGEPFVGKAGQLLDRMINAMGFERREVYIANIVKCRPPRNRAPLPDEMGACIGYLEEQISIVRPDVIVALGATAVRGLLGGNQGIARMRARFHSFRGIPVMPTYHPAYLLRSPEEKRKVWDDLQQVMRHLATASGEK